MELWEKLRILRVKSHQKQIEVAKQLKISNTALSNYEKGCRIPDIKTLKALANHYGVLMDDLITGIDIPEPSIIDVGQMIKKGYIVVDGHEYRFDKKTAEDLSIRLKEYLKTHENQSL